jgi:hypothetical protein
VVNIYYIYDLPFFVTTVAERQVLGGCKLGASFLPDRHPRR